MMDAEMSISERLNIDLRSPACYVEPGQGELWDPDMLRRKELIAQVKRRLALLNPSGRTSLEECQSSK